MSIQFKLGFDKFCILLIMVFPLYSVYAKNAIVPDEWYGRLGDQFLLYMATKKIALTYNLDFFYREFEFSDTLFLSAYDKKFDNSMLEKYSKVKYISKIKELKSIPSSRNTLFILKWSEVSAQTAFDSCSRKVRNANFLEHMRKMFSLVGPVAECLNVPAGYVSVAVHIRRGEGYDAPVISLRFPPDQYYIDQINQLTCLLSDKKFAIYIFSDSYDSVGLTERIRGCCKRQDLIFKPMTGVWKDCVFNDLYNMARCDCLICPLSHFSYLAETIGSHKVVIRPTNFEFQENVFRVTRALVSICHGKSLDNTELPFNEQNKADIQQLLCGCL